MANLDNLVAKILADSEARAKEITDAAKRDAEVKIADELKLAQAEADKIVADAEVEAKIKAEQIVQGKTLSIRDANLAAKREMLDKVFADALKQLNAMTKEDYVKYLSGYLAKLDLSGEELVVPAKYSITSIADIAPNAKVTLNTNPAHPIDGGFVLVKNGIEQNHTFEALLGYYRDDLEGEVLKILYA